MSIPRSLAVVATALGLLASSSSAAPTSQPAPSSLSDDFADASTLSQWQASTGEVRSGKTTFGVDGGVLTIHTGQSTWFRTQHGFYLWKPVTGDFVATVRLRVRGEHGPVPTANWSLAGLLLRAQPRSGGREDWLNFSVGRVSGSSVFERKTTLLSNSVLDLVPAPTGWLELRQVRVGPRFFLLYRPEAGAWRFFWVYLRTDLPPTLEVGVDSQTGTDDDHGDLVADVDFVHFRATGIPRPLRAKIVRGRYALRQVLPYLKR
jgi:hypothetical protein